MDKNRSCILALSGGMDSGTLLAQCMQVYYGKVQTVSFIYGSKHSVYEMDAAVELVSFYKVKHDVIDISTVGFFLSSNLLKSGGGVPEGHYQEESMKQTVVPARNMIFISILAGIAESRGITDVVIGIHAGDHTIYPDCRPEFYMYMKGAVQKATDEKVTLKAPFLHLDKAQILEWGLANQVPYMLTRTCYKEQAIPCGFCGACQERKEAFDINKTIDPITYAGDKHDAL
jgi:7-cyano-7-deazaguanine synthase